MHQAPGRAPAEGGHTPAGGAAASGGQGAAQPVTVPIGRRMVTVKPNQTASYTLMKTSANAWSLTKAKRQ